MFYVHLHVFTPSRGLQVLIGNPEKYKKMPVLTIGHVGRYKDSLYFSLVPAWYDCHSLVLFWYNHQIIPSQVLGKE